MHGNLSTIVLHDFHYQGRRPNVKTHIGWYGHCDRINNHKALKKGLGQAHSPGQVLETIKKSFNKNKQDLFFEYKVPSKRGEEKVIVWNIGQNKEHKIYTLIGRDVTTEREEEKKNEILQRKMEIEKIKNEFLSHVSKQFEFPIDTIISGIQLLEKEVLDKCEDNQNAISLSRHLSLSLINI